MSLVGTLARVAVTVGAAKGIGHVIGRATQPAAAGGTDDQSSNDQSGRRRKADIRGSIQVCLVPQSQSLPAAQPADACSRDGPPAFRVASSRRCAAGYFLVLGSSAGLT